MSGVVTEDFYGHRNIATAPALAAAAAGTSAVGTFIPVNAGLGAGSSVAITTATNPPNDTRGTINLVAAGVPAAGVVATVFFTQPYAQVPNVVVTGATAAGVSVLFAATAVTCTGFSIAAGALTAGTTYNVSYVVTP